MTINIRLLLIDAEKESLELFLGLDHGLENALCRDFQFATLRKGHMGTHLRCFAQNIASLSLST